MRPARQAGLPSTCSPFSDSSSLSAGLGSNTNPSVPENNYQLSQPIKLFDTRTRRERTISDESSTGESVGSLGDGNLVSGRSDEDVDETMADSIINGLESSMERESSPCLEGTGSCEEEGVEALAFVGCCALSSAYESLGDVPEGISVVEGV
jgi:hypothetical protein